MGAPQSCSEGNRQHLVHASHDVGADLVAADDEPRHAARRRRPDDATQLAMYMRLNVDNLDTGLDMVGTVDLARFDIVGGSLCGGSWSGDWSGVIGDDGTHVAEGVLIGAGEYDGLHYRVRYVFTTLSDIDVSGTIEFD